MIQSIDRATTILELFKEHPFLSLAEIASAVGLPKTTVHGLVSSLKEKDYLAQDPDTREYYLGVSLFELGSLYRSRLNLRTIAMPYLQELADRTKDTVQLAMLNGRHTVYLYKITTPNFMTFAVSEGVRAPAHCTSTGKAILAYLPKAQLERAFAGVELETPTPYSSPSFEVLYSKLEQVRENGYATDEQELHVGLGGAAVPLFDHQGDVCGAVCLSFPHNRFTPEYAERNIPRLKETAAQISQRLGCPASLLENL